MLLCVLGDSVSKFCYCFLDVLVIVLFFVSSLRIYFFILFKIIQTEVFLNKFYSVMGILFLVLSI